MREAFELKSCDLRYFCDHEIFTFKSTAEIEPLDEVIGQKRAVQAIEFGLNMKNPEYNIFVTGIEGTGKSTITTDITRKHAKTLPTPQDCCVVNNFQDPYRPKPLMVPAGKGSILSRQMDRLIQSLKSKMPKAFEDTAYQKKIGLLHDTFQKQEAERFSTLERNAKEKNLAISKTETRFQTIPVKNGKPLTQETFLKLSKKEQEQIEAAVQDFQGEIETALRDVSKIRQEQGKAVEALMSEIALSVVSEQMEFILETYDDCPEIKAYLEEVREHIVANANDFLPRREPDDRPQTVLFPEAVPAFQQYKVNVLVDRSDTPGAPVIFEPNPTYQNVFGHIEKKPHMGGMITDFTMIKTGSFLQADGGFLIMEIESLLMYPVVWESLKRALRSKRIVIEDMPAGQGIAVSSLRPQSIPTDVKVLLLGGYEPFQALQNFDPKFNKIFKVRADFDYEVERTDKTIQQYAKFVARVCQTETLLPFSPQGVAALVEFGDKIASNKNKLSLRFGAIVGIVKEADYWARKENAMLVSEKHVIKAFNEHRFRYNLYEEKIHESYSDGTVLIDVEGSVVGQVNGLAVHQIGDISFGRPSRITAETFMGKKGLVNIEREANLSGRAHDKGVLTLSGYLGRTFAQNQPLNLSISLTFEQNYNEVDGDSAASTELYAILSSLSGCPIDQGIAVTGSVNQKGKVQAIGGVNQKIEGFFDVCKTKGLTGHQGVLIPVANVKNLMLKKEVVNAVEEGNFHIYQVAAIEEGIQILTGTPVGTPDESGHYPDDTLYGQVEKRLKKYLDRERMFWRGTQPWEDAPGKGTSS
ncbi:MAG: AAA family ATPase [Deltaproteobacteria bacterium]|jgi:lon-related putative ATP-dependent protease|nr:AAA family ATPase [Deltaproteobacteria bacterium]